MKKKSIKIITIIGLISVMSLQILWLSNTYILIQKEMKGEINRSFADAIEKEVLCRLNSLAIPEGTVIEVGEEIEGILPGVSNFQEILINLNSHFSLSILDSIYTQLLEKASIETSIVINLINPNDSVLDTTNEGALSTWGTIETDVIPIRIDKSQNLQAIILNPYKVIFQRMGILLVATAFMMVFVAYCIITQIRIITRQNRIARLREDFSYSMIHDMKTPLTSIMMGTHILKSGKIDRFPEKQSKYLQIMEDEGEHLLTLANKILTIAKLEEKNITLEMQEVVLAPMINDLVEKFEAKATRQIEFTTRIDVETVVADAEYLKEAISNLIDNAIKYAKPTGVVKVGITTNEEGDHYQIRVKDNGLGISLKDQTKVFEKFERASAGSRTGKSGDTGFGLGLNYVQQVIAAHNGNVKIESIEGEGSEFIINIPKLTEQL